jgi:dihydroneopterin aldolase
MITDSFSSKFNQQRYLMDIVFIRELEIETVIGVYDWEREIKQLVVIDLEMGMDNRLPASTDNIEDALNYKAVGKRIISFIQASEFQLVETMAERVAEIVQNEFGVSWLKLQINKRGALRGAMDVGVIIERGSR